MTTTTDKADLNLNTAKVNRAMILAKLEATYRKHGLIYASRRAELGLPADLILGVIPNWNFNHEVPPAIDAAEFLRVA